MIGEELKPHREASCRKQCQATNVFQTRICCPSAVNSAIGSKMYFRLQESDFLYHSSRGNGHGWMLRLRWEFAISGSFHITRPPNFTSPKPYCLLCVVQQWCDPWSCLWHLQCLQIPPALPHIPKSLHPTPTHLENVHFQWIDRFPLPRLRDSMICLSDVFSSERFSCRYI